MFTQTCVYLSLYIYIYIYIQREREIVTNALVSREPQDHALVQATTNVL